MHIRTDDLRGPEICALLQEHMDAMHEHSPPESVHALDLDALRQPGISFWTAWEGTELLGCGAIKRLDADHAELKSMRTSNAHLRKGVARAILNHILDAASQQGFTRLSLETGTSAAFVRAHRLYAKAGFVECGPFEGYALDPNSVFMTKAL